MVIGLLGGSLGILVVALAPTVAVVLVGWCIAQLFFNALLAAMVAVLPDQVPTAQRGHGLRRAGRLPAHRVGHRHLSGPAVHRQPARHVPGALRDRRVLHPALRAHAERSPAGPGRTGRLVAARVRQHVLRQPAAKPGLRLGLRQPVPVRARLRVPHAPTWPTTCWTSSAAPKPMFRNRSSSAPSSSPSSSSPPPWSAAGSPTGPAGGRSSSSPRRSSTAWRCS